MICSLLRANSIPVMEKREAINVAYQFHVGALSAVRLYVPLHRAAEAEVLLKALAMERRDEPLLPEPDGEEPRLPQPGGDDPPASGGDKGSA